MWRAALVAIGFAGSSAWGSPIYGDPPGWCTAHSDMWTTTLVTNDPLVGTNPERDTFYGFHPNPGYDDWYGYSVVDIYVDAVPPQAPQPRVSRVTADSVSFTWDSVVDIGDGAGIDYFVAGMDHYTSWLTVGGGSQRLQLLSTPEPRTITQSGMSPLDIACVHVQAS